MAPFTYKPLQSPINIRLIKNCKQQDGVLSCELEEIELSDDYNPPTPPPKYTALSYTWGEGSSTVPLLCEGQELQITTNLAEALEMTLQANPNEYLWVDQICINQRDNEEKSNQVQKMTLIYYRAQSVLAWLGQEAADTALAVEWIQRVAGLTKGFGNDVFRDYENSDERRKIETFEELTDDQLEQLGVPISNEAAWRAFSAFYDRPWFERFWVVQEALPAREAWLVCGSQSVDWHMVKAAAAWYTYKAALIESRYQLQREIDGIAHSNAMNLAWRSRMGSEFLAQLLSQTVRATFKWAIDELLETFRGRQARDARDKIYALIGISTVHYHITNPLLAPDYNKSVREVYRDAMRGFIEVENYNALDLLLKATQHPIEPGWPSWVPDWRIAPVNDECMGWDLPQLRHEQGVTSKHTSVPASPGKEDELWVEGHIFGSIIHFSEENRFSGLLMNLRKERDECQKVYSEKFGADKYLPLDNGDTVDTAFAMSIQGGVLHKGFVDKETTEQQFGEALVDMVDVMKMPRDTPEENRARQLKVNNLMETIGLDSQWLNYTHGRCCGRRWFVTDKGFIGQGNQDMQTGDLVAVLWGLQTACILRPSVGTEEKNVPNVCGFIGEAYCHGATATIGRLERSEAGIPKSSKILLV